MLRTENETIFFFNGSRNRSLLGFLHWPQNTTKNIGIVYCHPFADEQNLSHRIAVNTARELAKNGFPVLRFDLSGCGDSEGDLTDVTIDDWKEDISLAIKIIEQMVKIDMVGLWGLRLGAGLILLHEHAYQNISLMILWQPIMDFSLYIKQFIRREVLVQRSEMNDMQMSFKMVNKQLINDNQINVIGYPLKKSLYDSFNMIGAQPMTCFPKCRTLLLSISQMDKPVLYINKYLSSYSDKNNLITSGHVNTETFWDKYRQWKCEEVTNRTVKWMLRNV